MTEETGASVVDSTRAHIAARAIFAMSDLWAPIEALDGAVAPDVQLRMILAVRHMVERGALWLLRHRRAPLDITATVAAFSTGARELSAAIPNVLFGSDREQLEATAAAYEAAGVGHDLAWRTAALDVAAVGDGHHRGRHCPGRIGEPSGGSVLRDHGPTRRRLAPRARARPRARQRVADAREAALRDDLVAEQRELTAEVLRLRSDDEAAYVLVD